MAASVPDGDQFSRGRHSRRSSPTRVGGKCLGPAGSVGGPWRLRALRVASVGQAGQAWQGCEWLEAGLHLSGRWWRKDTRPASERKQWTGGSVPAKVAPDVVPVVAVAAEGLVAASRALGGCGCAGRCGWPFRKDIVVYNIFFVCLIINYNLPLCIGLINP